MRQRWLGATGRRVPEIAVDGEVELPAETLVLDHAGDVEALAEAHRQGRPVVVRADSAGAVRAALARPEVACVLVPPGRPDLLALDLRALTYG